MPPMMMTTRKDQQRFSHARLDRRQRSDHHAGNTSKTRPDGEDKPAKQPDIDPQCRGHSLIVRTGPYHRPNACVRDQHVNADGAGKPYEDNDNAKHRVWCFRQNIDEARQHLRQIGKERRRAKADPYQLIKEKDKPKVARHLIHMITPIEMANQDEFKKKPAGECDRYGKQDTNKEIARYCGQARGGIGANHHLRTMRQKDKIHDAKDQRKPGCYQEKHHTELSAIE